MPHVHVCHMSVFLLIVALCAPSYVSAQDVGAEEQEILDNATKHYEQGRAFYDAGEYVEAADAFRKSYALTSAPILLYNIALAEWRAGNLRAARAAALRARRENLPPDIHVKLDAYLAGFDAIERTEVVAEAIDAADEPVTLVETAETLSARETPSSTTEPPRPDDPPRDEAHVLFGTGVAVAVLGAAGLTGALIVNGQVAEEAEQLDQPGGDSNDTIVTRIESQQRIGRILLFSGLAGFVGGGILMAMDVPFSAARTSRLRLTPMIGLTTGVGITTRF